ncbi:UDP-N-acetylmuramoyl-tripeptide--D-alanyl-D-alanine ligase [hydrothermal vent metagenome]|uniref:UDP-MurNAc-pentapeptide synthetase n=1 Tax=hydrothermal vent metagenome TaxID=652676 RepID=A0A3B0VYE0_9ZZZZ
MENQSECPEQRLHSMQTQIQKLRHSNEGKTMQTINGQFSWALVDLQYAVDGEFIGALDHDQRVRFTSISTDSRTLKAGALYIAIKGENFDGHDFITQAIQQGAVAVLVSEVIKSIVPAVLVEDTKLALGQFAKWHRKQMPVKKLIAVTGSNGKTTTKSLLLNIFQNVGNTLATEGNLNNDLGVPRTLLNLRPEHDYAIIEMGANHRNEISYLTHLAEPDIALITNAANAHLEGFGSLQGVVEAKGEIFQGLNQTCIKKDGVAVINMDSNGYLDWVQMIKSLGVQKIVRFGLAKKADIIISALKTSEQGVQFKLTIYGVSYAVKMPVLGAHNAHNAAACVAIALSSGLSWGEIQPGLTRFTGVAGRLQKQAITTGWLIDDSYNANPESVKAGINTLVSQSGYSILCLGAMAELGEGCMDAHQGIARYAKQKGVDYLLVYGQATQQMPEIFGHQSAYFESHERLAQHVADLLTTQMQAGKNVNVLVKGSRSAQMEKVSNLLLSQFGLTKQLTQQAH